MQNEGLSMQNDGLNMQNDGVSMQDGTADRSFCTSVQNGNMIRNGLILRLAGHDVKLGAPSKMTHYSMLASGTCRFILRMHGTEFARFQLGT